MNDYPVNVGQMLFTMVDPHRGHEVAFNRWYERDHFYAGCMIGPGWFAGRRWVATKTLKDLRFPQSSAFAEPLDAGSYLATYWLHAPDLDAANDWAKAQVVQLYADGRGFTEREHAHTGLYYPDSSVRSTEDGVPLELALDHEYKGLVVLVVEPESGNDRSTVIAEIERGPIRNLLDTGSADLVSSWRMRPWPADHNVPMSMGSEGGSDDRIVQLCFLDRAPNESWSDIEKYASEIEECGLGQVTFAAPFVPTVVGTDTYTDQLW